MKKELSYVASTFALALAVGVAWSALATPKPQRQTLQAELIERVATYHEAPIPSTGVQVNVAADREVVVDETPTPTPTPTQLPADYHARADGEWDGMLIDKSVAMTCDATEHCSKGQVCRRGTCLPCETDRECLVGESCVLDHCVPTDQVECENVGDCDGEFCILSGYDPHDPRNTATMTATCADVETGTPAPDPEVDDSEPEERPQPLFAALSDSIAQDFIDNPDDDEGEDDAEREDE